MSEEKGKTQKEFEGFVSSALRGPKMGIYQNLLAGLIIRASTTPDSLKKIQNLCEAAFLCKKKDKLDMGLVEVASTVCESFQNTNMDTRSIEVSWIFKRTLENYEKYIKPWQRIYISCYPLRTPTGQEKDPYYHMRDLKVFHEQEIIDIRKKRHKIGDQVFKILKKMPEYKAFFEQTLALSTHSFASLKGEFSRWALRQLLPIEAAIADQIDPSVYGEVAALMMGRKEEEEQIEGSMEQRQRRNKI